MGVILIAFERESEQSALEQLLSGKGHRVVKSGNGLAALDAARREPPHAVVSDIVLPRMDGFALCRKWKQDERLQAIPFLFYTRRHDDPKYERFALELGAERFLARSVPPETLVAALEELLVEVPKGNGSSGNTTPLPALDETVIQRTVGLDKAQRVWYRALDTYLTSDASYTDLRHATLLAAKDLYGAGGATYRALHSAWEAVGLLSVSTPGFSEVRTGGLTTSQAVIWPSTSGFSSDGSIIGFLGYDFADDFDLELWKLNTSTNTWSKVDDAVGPGNNEVVGYSGTAGQYRWRVKATSGSGGYSLGWNP